jgi:hypothetical protein
LALSEIEGVALPRRSVAEAEAQPEALAAALPRALGEALALARACGLAVAAPDRDCAYAPRLGPLPLHAKRRRRKARLAPGI